MSSTKPFSLMRFPHNDVDVDYKKCKEGTHNKIPEMNTSFLYNMQMMFLKVKMFSFIK